MILRIFATELVDTLNNPFIAATYLMGLNANPTADAMAAAYKSARVFITGNFSNIHGGGIMCNGILLGGEVPTDEIHITVGAVTLPVDKIYLNKETGEKVPLNKDQFKFVLAKEVEVKDGKVTAKGETQTFTNDANGLVNIRFPLTAVGELVFYLMEVQDSQTGVTYDDAVYKLTVMASKDRDEYFNLDGVIGITTTILKGDVTVTEMIVAEEGNRLEDGEAVEGNKITFTNHYTPPEEPEEPTTSVTVNKVWKGDEGQNRPDSITVELYGDGAIYDTVQLTKDGGWTHTWTDLAIDVIWTVKEVVVPGYTSKVTNDGNDFTITNTWQPPEEPGKPGGSDPDPVFIHATTSPLISE